MSREILLPCGHAYDPSASGPPPDGTTVVCPVCHATCDTPPPPRAPAVAASVPLAGLETKPASGTLAATGLPTVVGYEVLATLGRGGMGVVYKARQLSLNRLVALKMVLAGPHADAEFLARFKAEAEAAARLQHPNIVQIHDVGEQDGRPYIALELVDGGSLRDRLGVAPLPPGDAAGLVEALARAMQHAHQRGIVHRDLKPANVLLVEGGGWRVAGEGAASSPATRHRPPSTLFPKIADFGLAKQLDSDSGQTRTGAILGTPSYMAPEQAEGRARDVGPRTDVYALGAILYECLTGRPPFRGATTLDTLEQVRFAEPVPVRQLQPKCPRDLETITLKCLRKEAGQRYASAEALAEDLRRFREGRPIQARPVGPLGRFTRWCRRSPVVAGLSAGLFVALTAGLVGVSWKWYEADHQRQRAEAAETRASGAQRGTAAILNAVLAQSLADVKDLVGQDSRDAGGDLDGLLRKLGDRPGAIRSFERTCAEGEKVFHDFPSGPLQGAVAKSYAQLSILQAAAGRREEAARSAHRGVELLDARGLDDPASLGTPEELGKTAFLLGALLMNLGRYDEAAAAFRQAVVHQRTALDEAPMDSKRRKLLSISYYHLDHVLLKAGHVAESAASVRERRQLWPDNADEVYDTACELARCAARGGAERRRYADEAVAVLRQAIALGLKDAAAVQADPDLNVLHDRDDFRQLVAEMARKEKKER